MESPCSNADAQGKPKGVERYGSNVYVKGDGKFAMDTLVAVPPNASQSPASTLTTTPLSGNSNHTSCSSSFLFPFNQPVVINSASNTTANSSSGLSVSAPGGGVSSTRYPAKIHYKLNRNSPTNASSSGCQTANNSPATSNVSSPIGSDQFSGGSPLVSPTNTAVVSGTSNGTNHNENSLYNINEEGDSAMMSESEEDEQQHLNNNSTSTTTPLDCYASFSINQSNPIAPQHSPSYSLLQTQSNSKPHNRSISISDIQNNNSASTDIHPPQTHLSADTPPSHFTHPSGTPQTSTAISFPHFHRGSVIELSNRSLKRIEDVTTDDLLQSSGSNCLSFADVHNIRRLSPSQIPPNFANKSVIEITLHANGASLSTLACMEQPFISKNEGWVSANPEVTSRLYGLSCQPIGIGSQLLIGFTSTSVYQSSDSDMQKASQIALQGASMAQSQGGPHSKDALVRTSASPASSVVNGKHDSGTAVTGGPRSAFTPIPMSPSRQGSRKRALDLDSGLSNGSKASILHNKAVDA